MARRCEAAARCKQHPGRQTRPGRRGVARMSTLRVAQRRRVRCSSPLLSSPLLSCIYAAGAPAAACARRARCTKRWQREVWSRPPPPARPRLPPGAASSRRAGPPPPRGTCAQRAAAWGVWRRATRREGSEGRERGARVGRVLGGCGSPAVASDGCTASVSRSRLLGDILATSRRHLGDISATSRPDLGQISARSRLAAGGRLRSSLTRRRSGAVSGAMQRLVKTMTARVVVTIAWCATW